MTSSTPSSRLIPHRIAAFLAGALILLGGAIISMGTALLAPIGMGALSAYRRQRRGSATRASTWMAAMTWVAAGMFALTLIMFDALPGGTMREIQHSADSASAASYKKPPPAWVERLAPGTTARAAQGSSTPASLQTPLLLWSVGVGLLLLAGVVGSIGWAGAMLCGFAITGRWPNDATRPDSGDIFTPGLGNALTP